MYGRLHKVDHNCQPRRHAADDDGRHALHRGEDDDLAADPNPLANRITNRMEDIDEITANAALDRDRRRDQIEVFAPHAVAMLASASLSDNPISSSRSTRPNSSETGASISLVMTRSACDNPAPAWSEPAIVSSASGSCCSSLPTRRSARNPRTIGGMNTGQIRRARQGSGTASHKCRIAMPRSRWRRLNPPRSESR